MARNFHREFFIEFFFIQIIIFGNFISVMIPSNNRSFKGWSISDFKIWFCALWPLRPEPDKSVFGTDGNG